MDWKSTTGTSKWHCREAWHNLLKTLPKNDKGGQPQKVWLGTCRIAEYQPPCKQGHVNPSFGLQCPTRWLVPSPLWFCDALFRNSACIGYSSETNCQETLRHQVIKLIVFFSNWLSFKRSSKARQGRKPRSVLTAPLVLPSVLSEVVSCGVS